MRMVEFRVQNFKKVNDTGWITTNQITALVGKNEAGKSAIFRGLSKLNPSDGTKYDGLKEFPRRRYTSEFHLQDWPVSSAKFELSATELDELKKIGPALAGIKSVICTRYYSSDLEIVWNPSVDYLDVTNQAYSNLLKQWRSDLEQAVAPEGEGDSFAQVKNNILQILTKKIQLLESRSADEDVDESIVTEVSTTIAGQITEQWQKDILKQILVDGDKFKKALELNEQLVTAEEWVEEHLPKFIYFDRYDVIDSAIHIPTFIQQLNQTPPAPRLRTTRCLFQHVGLDLESLQQLDPTQQGRAIEELRRMADERAILMSSASSAMTQKFSEWWEQRRHRFRYQIDGPWFRVWVSDDLDPSEIELDQRSAGMQYFFSFYLVFLVEAEDAHRGTILLLDEPGIHLHGTAQQKIVEFLEKISQQNQLLYSTHSPFMVDGDHLENVKIVYEDRDDGASKVSEDVWPKDKDSLFPLQAALGYNLAQTLFYAKRQIVVEGISDYWILTAMNTLLSKLGRTALRADAVIVPCGGVNKLMPLVSMLRGHDIKTAVLLDGDEPGLRKGKDVETKLLTKCLFISTFAEQENAELEDMFEGDFYIDAVKKAYPKTDITFSNKETQIPEISKRVETLLKRRGIEEFEKWRPARVILDEIQIDGKSISEETLQRFEKIFKEVNGILSD